MLRCLSVPLRWAVFPAQLDDLLTHHYLLYTLNGHVYDKWSFPDNGIKHQLTVSSHMLCDDAALVRRWAVAGMGVAYKSWIDVSSDVLLREQRKAISALMRSHPAFISEEGDSLSANHSA